jgi:hypothetical protein
VCVANPRRKYLFFLSMFLSVQSDTDLLDFTESYFKMFLVQFFTSDIPEHSDLPFDGLPLAIVEPSLGENHLWVFRRHRQSKDFMVFVVSL